MVLLYKAYSVFQVILFQSFVTFTVSCDFCCKVTFNSLNISLTFLTNQPVYFCVSKLSQIKLTTVNKYSGIIWYCFGIHTILLRRTSFTDFLRFSSNATNNTLIIISQKDSALLQYHRICKKVSFGPLQNEHLS